MVLNIYFFYKTSNLYVTKSETDSDNTVPPVYILQ